jgi:hypothetical protein
MLKANHPFEIASHFELGVISGKATWILIVGLESMLATWMLIGGFNPARFWCAIGCFSLFAAAACFEAMHAHPSCGCFGKFQVPPRVTANFDLMAVISLFFSRPQVKTWTDRWPIRHRLGGAVAITLLASACLTLILSSAPASAASRSVESANQDPSSSVGREFPFFDEIIASPAEMRLGRWIVIFYHFDCDECRKGIPAYLRFAENEQAGTGNFRFAFVAVPPFAPAGHDLVPSSEGLRHFELRQDRKWLLATPLVVTIEDGKVLNVAEGADAVIPQDSSEPK